jgi:hypothetical protein
MRFAAVWTPQLALLFRLALLSHLGFWGRGRMFWIRGRRDELRIFSDWVPVSPPRQFELCFVGGFDGR